LSSLLSTLLGKSVPERKRDREWEHKTCHYQMQLNNP
jgi:hypothetical protein